MSNPGSNELNKLKDQLAAAQPKPSPSLSDSEASAPLPPAPPSAPAQVVEPTAIPKIAAQSTPSAGAAPAKQPAPPSKDVIDANGIDILNNLSSEKLEALVNAVQERIRAKTVTKNVSRHVTDFKAVRESDVFNLNIPIEAISHEAPDFMKVTLKDPEYVARWVMKHPARVGTMKAMGFTYVTPEDLAEELNLEIDVDADNHYRYIDTVLMKVNKSKYFPRLRKHFLRSQDSIQQRRVQESQMQLVEQDIATVPDEHGRTYGNDFEKYNREGKMRAYIPGVSL